MEVVVVLGVVNLDGAGVDAVAPPAVKRDPRESPLNKESWLFAKIVD